MHTPTSPCGVRQRPRLKVISSRAVYTWGGTKGWARWDRGGGHIPNKCDGWQGGLHKREGQKENISVVRRPEPEKAESWFIWAQLSVAEWVTAPSTSGCWLFNFAHPLLVNRAVVRQGCVVRGVHTDHFKENSISQFTQLFHCGCVTF